MSYTFVIKKIFLLLSTSNDSFLIFTYKRLEKKYQPFISL